MEVSDLITFLIVGAIAGWLGSKLMGGRGFGLKINLILGVIGAVVGGFGFALVGITMGGIVASIISATVGAMAVLFVVGLFKGR